MKKLMLVFSLFFLLFISGCSMDGITNGDSVDDGQTFKILSGSENKDLEPIIQKFATDNNVKIKMDYKGSVDIMNELKNSNTKYNAVWTANSIWIAMGDKNKVTKYQKSIMTTPVVFGIQKSKAKELGFIDKKVSIKDILGAIEQKKLTFMMTSATQSNSGASAYIGFLYGLLNNPDMITSDDLKKEELNAQVKTLLSGVNRSSGSSDWLKDLYLKSDYNAMVNYESIIISTNNELVKQGKEPLYIIYPYDALTIADSPFAYINKGDATKEKTFQDLQTYLLSSDVQNQIASLGRRVGFAGDSSKLDKNIFKSEWGIDTTKILSPIRMPSPNVIEDALILYQTELKKPSFTIYCLDYSGSMSSNGGEKQLKEAMKTILDQTIAKENLLQATKDDVTIVIPFSDAVKDVYRTNGNDEANLKKTLDEITTLSADGGTDIYAPVIEALDIMSKENLDKYSPAIVLMTDGKSNENKFNQLSAKYKAVNKDIPVFSITFGSADTSQLDALSDSTKGHTFTEGKSDLVGTFKKVKGYN